MGEKPLFDVKNVDFANVINLKSDSDLFQKRFFLLQSKLFKYDKKMVFTCFQMLFSILRYLNFCPGFLVMRKDGLIKGLRLISRSMMSRAWRQAVVGRVLPNVSGGGGYGPLGVWDGAGLSFYGV